MNAVSDPPVSEARVAARAAEMNFADRKREDPRERCHDGGETEEKISAWVMLHAAFSQDHRRPENRRTIVSSVLHSC